MPAIARALPRARGRQEMQTREDDRHRDSPGRRRRILCLWFPLLPLDRHARDEGGGAAARRRAIVVVSREGRTARLVAASVDAQACGLAPGMTLADARAIEPALEAVAQDREADRRFLLRIARWAGSRAPHVALDGEDGLLLDITGAAHLSGGEEKLRRATMAALARAGVSARAAIAPGAVAARAMCRFHPAAARGDGIAAIVAAGAEAEALAGLPPDALGLPAATTGLLGRLGIARIGDLAALPRDGLAARFGDDLLARIDEALGRREAPISPLAEEADWSARRAFAEPISTPDDLGRVAGELAHALCRRLARAGRGARRLELRCLRIDGRREACAIALAAPASDAARIARLLAARIEAWRSAWTDAATRAVQASAPAELQRRPVGQHGRRLHGLGQLEQEGRARRADGPERIAPEWWRADARGPAARARDYYRVEDEDGARLWMFRDAGDGAGAGDAGDGRWFVHGIFA